MTTNELINTLKQQLKRLEQDVLQHDSHLHKTQQKMLLDIERFNRALFIQSGAKLFPCIEQIAKNIQQLEKQLTFNLTSPAILYHCERIQDQFTAVKRALKATNLDVKTAQHKKTIKRNQAIKRNQLAHQDSGFSWIASNVMQNSHKLYDERNKHLDWQKKMQHKIEVLQSQLANCHKNDKIVRQNDILLLHRRLGKCRQAITYIEERIQLFERPNKNRNY
ncbi:primosomal replication protein [Shewanella surugensis]|uniref:Primosomal replication protein n=1 Tax=Shewanella surugensis TaxID=212020 RepID=A0ABT0L8T8_9GAMM|nr:primosomal replication protein [Shewanella surugensis]MCL1123915.1 primosomal replication protein [Shewanella surugensis]